MGSVKTETLPGGGDRKLSQQPRLLADNEAQFNVGSGEHQLGAVKANRLSAVDCISEQRCLGRSLAAAHSRLPDRTDAEPSIVDVDETRRNIAVDRKFDSTAMQRQIASTGSRVAKGGAVDRIQDVSKMDIKVGSIGVE